MRFVPFAQLAACVAGGATLGLLLQGLTAPDLAAVGFVLIAGVYADARSHVVRYWADWNYTGLEAKELWPEFRGVADRLRGAVGDPRVAVEYSSEHEQAGSIRMYETLPFFSGRSTLEGVYNQASLQTHFVYYLASELGATSPNPFKNRQYSRFDTALRSARVIETTPEAWQRALAVHRLLAGSGAGLQRSVRVVDLIVAAVAELLGHPVVHCGQDYEQIARLTGQPTRRVCPEKPPRG